MRGFTQNRTETVVLLLIVGVVLITPAIGGRLEVYDMTLIALFATVVISLNLMFGLAGQATFAQTAFMAIGGYGSALLTTRFHVDPWLAMLIATLASFAVAFVMGKPLFRLRGHYLSMATFAFALGTASFVKAAQTITNGSNGINGIPPFAIGSFTLDDPMPFYVLSWLLCAVALVVVAFLANSHMGRALRALATKDSVAMTLGIDVPGYKLMALVISAVIASIAGSFYVEFTSFAGPDLYDIPIIINLLFMLFAGGVGSTVGPIAGAAFVILVPQVFAGLEQYQNIVFFLLLLMVILLRPTGMFGRDSGTRGLQTILPAWMLNMRRSDS